MKQENLFSIRTARHCWVHNMALTSHGGAIVAAHCCAVSHCCVQSSPWLLSRSHASSRAQLFINFLQRFASDWSVVQLQSLWLLINNCFVRFCFVVGVFSVAGPDVLWISCQLELVNHFQFTKYNLSMWKNLHNTFWVINNSFHYLIFTFRLMLTRILYVHYPVKVFNIVFGVS